MITLIKRSVSLHFLQQDLRPASIHVLFETSSTPFLLTKYMRLINPFSNPHKTNIYSLAFLHCQWKPPNYQLTTTYYQLKPSGC